MSNSQGVKAQLEAAAQELYDCVSHFRQLEKKGKLLLGTSNINMLDKALAKATRKG